jgi:outer membrane protein assembly factor BamB
MRKTAAIILGIIFLTACISILASSSVNAATSSNVDWWPSYGHDLTHTRSSSSNGPRTNQVLWTFQAGGQVRASAAVVDGVAYTGTFGGYFYAIDANTGKEIWSFKTDTDIWASPAVADGQVFVGSNGGTLYALSTTSGQVIWEFKTGSALFNGPAVVGDVVYEASNDGNLYALNAATGAEIWSFDTGGQCRSSPAIVGGVVYLGSLGGGKIFAIDASTGSELWSFTTKPGDTYMDSSPAVVDGILYIGSTDANVYALDAKTGSKVWSYQTGSKVSSSPAVVGGVVYVGSEDSNLYALNAKTGEKIWSYAPGGIVYSSPSIANNVLYVGTWNGAIHAVDTLTGRAIWTYPAGQVFASPAIANGVVYVGSYDGNVYAFGTPGSIITTNNTLPPVFTSKVANGTAIASSKITMTLKSPNATTSYYEVRADGGNWVNTGLSTSYTFSGLSLGQHVLEGRAIDQSGATVGSSNATVNVTVWVPPATNAIASGLVTAGLVTLISLAAATASSPVTIAGSWISEKVSEILPDGVKGWFESYLTSKRSLVIENKDAPLFLLTKLELVAYVIALIILTFAFAYSGSESIDQFLLLIPTVLATSVVVGLVKNLITEIVSRILGVWSEHRLWYLGLATFLLSTIAFKAPFSSPSRIVNHSPKATKRILGLVASASIVSAIGFAAIFYMLLVLGFTYIGSIGLGMCLLSSLFDSIPVAPMNGKDIYDWNKLTWGAIFIISMLLYALWLLYI